MVANTKLFFRSMDSFVASFAKRQSIGNLKTQFRICSERLKVVSMEIPTFAISAMLASKIVSGINIKPPSFIFGTKSKPQSLYALAVNISVAIFSSWCALSCYSANLFSCFKRMLFADSIAWPSFGRIAHFFTRFSRKIMLDDPWPAMFIVNACGKAVSIYLYRS